MFGRAFKNTDDILGKKADCATTFGQEELMPLRRIMDQDSFANAVADQRRSEAIEKVFVEFQKFPYREAA